MNRAHAHRARAKRVPGKRARLAAFVAASPLAMLACALLAVAVAGSLSGCGLKGSLYLPQQKKSKVPETPNNPAADAPDPNAPQPSPSPTEPTPSDAAPGASTPHA
jgi:predicted small lipoprotein YifL